METNALDYTLTAIVNEENEVYLVAFHFHTFTVVELNYDTYDKELLAIFEAFKILWHYLECSAYLIDIVTNHKTLEYFFTTKVLIWRQAWWSEYLSQFNLIIRFHPSYLDIKPDALTRWWNIYLKGGNTGYATVNPHNFKLILTQEQLTASIQATILLFSSFHTATIIYLDTLHQDILLALPSDLIATKHISADSQ